MNNKGNILIGILFSLFMLFIGLLLLNSFQYHLKVYGNRYLQKKKIQFLKNVSILTGTEICKRLTNFTRNDLEKEVEEIKNTLFLRDRYKKFLYHNDIKLNKITQSNYDIYRLYLTQCFTDEFSDKEYNNELLAVYYCGNIPITSIPFYLNDNSNQLKSDYFRENKIYISDKYKNTIPFKQKEISIKRAIKKTIKYSGTEVSWREIRIRAGYPVSNLPLECGIYYLQVERNSSCIDSLFIQGDIDSLNFYTESESQIISITQGTQTVCFRYIPGAPSVSISNEMNYEDYQYNENIVVNGKIREIKSTGIVAFQSDTDIALFVNGSLNIKSSLEAKIDHNRVSGSNIKILTGSLGLMTDYTGSFDITIETKNKARLSASIISEGTIKNLDSSLVIYGSVLTRKIENNGILSIEFRKKGNSLDDSLTIQGTIQLQNIYFDRGF